MAGELALLTFLFGLLGFCFGQVLSHLSSLPMTQKTAIKQRESHRMKKGRKLSVQAEILSVYLLLFHLVFFALKHGVKHTFSLQ